MMRIGIKISMAVSFEKCPSKAILAKASEPGTNKMIKRIFAQFGSIFQRLVSIFIVKGSLLPDVESRAMLSKLSTANSEPKGQPAFAPAASQA